MDKNEKAIHVHTYYGLKRFDGDDMPKIKIELLPTRRTLEDWLFYFAIAICGGLLNVALHAGH